MMLVALAAILHCLAAGHLIWTMPPQRGLLAGNQFITSQVFDKSAPRDFLAHFPAGSRNTRPGSGMASQKRAAGPAGWTPYEPEKPSFRFRAGVCGDADGVNDHVRGGKYYFGGKVTKTYPAGGVISVDAYVVTHHNGFMEARLCDVSRCDGEISKSCFRKGACKLLHVAPVSSCETRRDRMCAPVDPKYPGRWHFPCPSGGNKGNYGKGKILYRLPAGWSGKHFVLQFYHVAANACMPPGVTDYFKSDRGPQWGNCKGQGEAVGGYRRWPTLCGGNRFAEEYYHCADIAITGGGGGAPRPMTPKKAPPAVQPPSVPVKAPVPPSPPQTRVPPQSPPQPRVPPPAVVTGTRVGVLQGFVLIGDGRVLRPVGSGAQSFGNGARVRFNVRGMNKIVIAMKTAGRVRQVVFFIDKRGRWVERNAPYTYLASRRWNPIIGRAFELKAESGRDTMTATAFLSN